MEQGLCSSADLRKYLLACENGEMEWVDNALQSGIVQVDASDEQGFTGLQMAAANGREDLVRLLIMRGAALDKCNQYDWTPLLHAARHGHTAVVALLLQNGAEINKRTCMGANALTCAVKGGHTKTASYLLDRQIEFDVAAAPCELSAMSVSCLLGHDAALRLLSDRGWDINQRMQSTFVTPLMCAAINGHMTTAQNLMERGCDPNLTDVNDKTALQLAQDRGKREVFGFLDRKTSNKLSIVQEEDFRMDIVEATKIGDISRVREILLADNAQKDFCLPLDGATPLMYASMSGRIDIAMLLVENGCDINKQDKISNWTALMQAIFHGKKQVAKFLIASGADVSLSAKNGITAFDMASFIDDVDTDLLRLVAAKSMANKSNKKDTLKRLSGKNGSGGAEFAMEGGGKKWWSRFSSHLKSLTKTFQIKGSKMSDSSSTKAKMKMTKMNSTSTMNLGDFSDLPNRNGSGALSFMDKKKSASLYHLNSMTPHSTVTMPLGLGGGGASGGETLKPVIPPFLPQPSYELTAETWGLPTQQKSQSTLDLTVNNKHPMIRPMSGRSGRDGPASPSSENRFSFGSPSPNSSGGASSISAMYSAPTSGSSATSSTLTPNNVDRINRRSYDFDSRHNKTPSFLFNSSNHKYSSQPRLSPTGFSPSSSINSAIKRNRLSSKSRNNTSPNLTASSRQTKGSAALYDSGTSTGNSEMLSSSSSSQGVILELEGEQAEENEANDLGSVLKNLSLEKYQSIFEKEEVDMEAFLMLDEKDLCELGITHTDSQRQILSAISDLSSNNHVQRHRNEINDNIEATIPVRNSVHSDSTDMDEWYLHSQPNLTPTTSTSEAT